ncbi:MAG: hypothetical protein QOH81_3213 [Sphingomonadales bacterium]|jgi:hypothetical protein|nr:hypothetical protein [Sphingomonadales bacterium]
MSLALAAAMLAGQAAMPEPPPGLLFGYYRMFAFQQRAKELHCPAGNLDSELETIRTQLIRRYGKKPFSPPRPPPGGPGDCETAVVVYRVNLTDFRKEAAAALAAPVPIISTPAE